MTFDFDRNTPYWTHFDSRQFSRAIWDAVQLLNGEKQRAPDEYRRAHKGTPFYMMAFAAFASNDFGTATFLFDAAVSEDLKNHPTQVDTPALLFMQLNDKNQRQLAKDLVAYVR